MKIFTFWRSLASFRVRIGLNLKGLAPEQVFVDLFKGQHCAPAYLAINPQGLLPALIEGEGPPLVQSLAILEYLDETHPSPPLLPADPRGRARARALAQIAAGDAHSLVTPRVRGYLAAEFGVDETGQTKWAHHWLGLGLQSIEEHLTRESETGLYCHGDTVTIADISVVSVAVGHQLFGGALDAYPRLAEIIDRCLQLEAFSAAHPLKQPGAPKAA
ncbi:maleylacetoacetate isomerase [Methylocella tundrae]|uniref:Maleylacetoacetate isomerase n=1 Tax=Methylocella tundrae TaxID=227605 RepID=A0A4U8Z646_METTU|nr:maleylacetoacetate isomerase [Methylocella tundrae]WPP04596.1 maleylacetoacetate isomerase [Methylocella tundrae]VFU11022.1 Maleylacetoacetate isomerase [Methylocella tundrae]